MYRFDTIGLRSPGLALTKREPCHGGGVKVNFQLALPVRGERAILGHHFMKDCPSAQFWTRGLDRPFASRERLFFVRWLPVLGAGSTARLSEV
jgi:hypothetical protein